MLPEFGQLALALALATALVQSVLPIWGAARDDAALMRTGETTAMVQFGLVAVAFACLMHAFMTSDFSVLNVVQNSSLAKPMVYKVSGTWGSHEGSLLLWVLILALFGAVVGRARTLPEGLKARTLSVQAWIGVGFLSFMIFTSNPFERVFPAPADGTDLNPLLQDIGLALHPPLLYLGYVGFSIVFSFAVAALIEGKVDPAWARWVRPWTLAAWAFLTAGIGLGAWWAYYELGWGGWWFWDPVENVSFMPWLLGTALLHSAIVTEKRDTFKSWTILLAVLTFSLSLLGTFIVRSGLLTSVHAFAVDPERGVYILVLLAIAIGGALALYAWRAPALEGGGLFAPVSRETGLLINNLLLAVSTATVLFGTLYPLFLEAITGEKISVGPPFFNATFTPLMMPLILVMAIGPFLAWKRADLGSALSRLVTVGLLTLLVVVIVAYATRGGPILAPVVFGLAVWLLLATVQDWAMRLKIGREPVSQFLVRLKGLPRAAHGMALAHAGVAICTMGIVGSTAWKSEIVTFVEPGTTVEIGGYDVRFKGIEPTTGPNYRALTGTLTVMRGGETVTVLRPERRTYPLARTTTTEAAIHHRLAGDLFATLAEPEQTIDNAGRWTLRILFEPLINLIWTGTALLVIGGAMSLSDRRLRVGAPRRARRTAPVRAAGAVEGAA